MRFADSINHNDNIPKPIKYANSDSSLFNSSESLSDDTSSSDNLLSNQSKTNHPSNTISPFKQFLTAPDTNQSLDRTCHQSQNQSTSYTTDNRTTKTHYSLRHQPKMDNRLFISPSKL